MGGDLCVARRCVDATVAEQHLDHARVRTVLQKMGGEGMAQRMSGDALRQTALLQASLQANDSEPAERCLFSRQEGNIQMRGRAARQ